MDKITKQTLYFIALALGIHGVLLFVFFRQETRVIQITIPAKIISTQLTIGEENPSVQKDKQSDQRKLKKFFKPLVKAKDKSAKQDKIFQKAKSAISNTVEKQSEGSSASSAVQAKSPASQVSRSDIETYIRQVVRLLDKKKRYPRLSKKNGEEGRVTVLLEIDRSGKLVNYRLIQKSDHDRLNQATASTVKSTTYPPLPAGYTNSKIIIKVPLRYSLRKSRG